MVRLLILILFLLALVLTARFLFIKRKEPNAHDTIDDALLHDANEDRSSDGHKDFLTKVTKRFRRMNK